MGILDIFRSIFRHEPAATVRDSMAFAGRARLITHLLDAWGEEGAAEFSFPSKPAGFEPVLVFEFAPWRERTWWTYGTAGLSICPAMDNHPPIELLVYAHARSLGLVDLLYQVALKENPATVLRAGDLVSFEGAPPNLGIPLGQHYGLVSAPEEAEVTNFPDPGVRPEDERYVMARPREDRTRLTFLRVVALKDADLVRWNSVRGDTEASHAWQLF
jgi:hypothetical protein